MKQVYKNNQAGLLAKEIIVLFIFTVLLAFSILFLFPAASENIFFINLSGNLDISNFSSDKKDEKIFEKSDLLQIDEDRLKNKKISEVGAIDKIFKGQNYLEIFLVSSSAANPGNYFKLNLNAKNNGGVDFPEGSINIKWKYENEKSYAPLNQENIKIYIDCFSHNYFAAVSENKNWKLDKEISSFMIEVPDVEGVNITINNVSFNKRALFPLDSYINRFFRENFNIREINRFLIPAYIGLLFILAVTWSLKLISGKVMTAKIIFGSVLIILFIFSVYFFKNEILNVKSYYDSYRKNILSGDFKNTYLGFYDFEKFISWADSKIPENENIIVLIRGEQVYIESEMAYNLYPRDVKFINISSKPQEKIISEINNINAESKVKTGDKNFYKYLI
ncbi:MAG: hypothetical protein M1475_07300, partial [Actinobacteria bacterium]|nr:hypothetical protein [Actinomycetota bacterium]